LHNFKAAQYFSRDCRVETGEQLARLTRDAFWSHALRPSRALALTAFFQSSLSRNAFIALEIATGTGSKSVCRRSAR